MYYCVLQFYSLYKQELLRKAWEVVEKPAATQDKVKPSTRVRWICLFLHMSWSWTNYVGTVQSGDSRD